MGGKHKQQSQRTKNNARPSSSGRSAELLGSTMPHFVGFSSVKESNFVLPGLSCNAELDSTIDPNFQLVLKKMNKKDATTKLKALQEFAELTKSAETKAVKAVLPFWPRLFCILATDTDHRVREAVHIAHQQVVVKMKKNLAPHLKQIIGAWFAGQYDTYPPAASAATQSFQSVFPPNKINDAIVFCQEEILAYICDNLTVHTAQTLSNPKTTSAEDAEAKYQRILISSMHGYALYLRQLPAAQIAAAKDLNLKIIGSNRFWKLAKHKVTPIRAAFFTVMAALCERATCLLEHVTANVVACVFGNLDESEPIVLPVVWEAALMIFLTIDEWWKFINVEKAMLPKLWHFLREGGQGSASRVYPNLLPLISHLPPVTDINTVYCSFFENMRLGLKRKTVLESRAESTAVTTSFIECLKYVIMKNQSDVALCEKLIKTQLIAVLELALNDRQIDYKIVFNQITGLVQYWSRNATAPDTGNYTKYLHYFWTNVHSLYEGLLMNFEHNYDRDALNALTTRQIELMLALRTFKARKTAKVSFECDKCDDPIECNSETNVDATYLNSLNDLVVKTCTHFVRIVRERKSKMLIDSLVKLMRNFDSVTFVESLNAKEARAISIYDNLLKVWLNDGELCCESVVCLIFLLFNYLSAEEKSAILEDFIKVQPVQVLGWCLNQIQCDPHNLDESTVRFYDDPSVSQFLVDLTERKLNNTSTPELDAVLNNAFNDKPNGELFVAPATITRIVATLTQAFAQPANYPTTLNECIAFAAHLTTTLFAHTNQIDSGQPLLLSLFDLCANAAPHHHLIAAETLASVNAAWQHAVHVLCDHLQAAQWHDFVEQLAHIIQRQFLAESVLDVRAQHCTLIVQFIERVRETNASRVNDVLAWLLQRDFVPRWRATIEHVCKRTEYVAGTLCCPYASFAHNHSNERAVVDDNDDDGDAHDFVKYFKWMEMIGGVFLYAIDDEGTLLGCSVEETPQFRALLVEIAYSVTLGESYARNYPCTKYSNYIADKSRALHQHLATLCAQCPEARTELALHLTEKVRTENWLWTRTVYNFYANIEPTNLSTVYADLVNRCVDNRLAMVQLTCVFARHLNYTDMPSKLEAAESFVVLRSLIECVDIEVPISEAFARIEALQMKNRALFLYESAAINAVTWSEIEIIIEVIRLYAMIIKHKAPLVGNRWDLITVPLSIWTTNIVKQKAKYQQVQIAAFIVALSQLLHVFNDYIRAGAQQTIVEEWRDVFAQDLHKDIIDLWLFLANDYNTQQPQQHHVNSVNLYVLQEFGQILPYVDHTYVFTKRPEHMPKWHKLVQVACNTITQSIHCVQLCSYYVLVALLPGLVHVDAAAVHANRPHQNGLVIEQLRQQLVATQDIIQTLLLDFKIAEDSCRIEPFTDSYTYTAAYFLIWDVVLRLCEQSSTELRYQYADWLRNNEFLTNLLGNIFKLIPLDVLQHTEAHSRKHADLFASPFSTSLTETPSSERIEHMACWIYARALAQLPAIVRQWWTSRDTRTAQLIEKVTSVYMTPLLCARELEDVARHERTFKNMTVKTHPGAREVVAIYTVDEAQMELVITLPLNYPLGSPEVQCNRQICGTSHRQWLMQFKMCVLHQNGRIWDGLQLWNNNLDRKFDGVEECYICFAVLHQGTYQLPRLTCQTCKKKFHSACLYKWFSTSNKSTCPICRNLF